MRVHEIFAWLAAVMWFGLYAWLFVDTRPSDFSPSDWMMCEPAMVEKAGAPALALRCHRDTVVVLADSLPLPQRAPARLPERPPIQRPQS